jgi:hypothetical protein
MVALWRRREDVSRVRFIIALLVAPLPFSLMFTLIFPARAPLLGISVILGLHFWFLMFGLLCDFCIARPWGRIGLVGCLVAGAVGAFILPFAVLIIPFAADPPITPRPAWREIASALYFAIHIFYGIAFTYFVPAGLVIGWLTWLIGVWPARKPVLPIGGPG